MFSNGTSLETAPSEIFPKALKRPRNTAGLAGNNNNNNNNNNNSNNGNPQLVVQLPPQSTTHKTLRVMINKDVSGKLAFLSFSATEKLTDNNNNINNNNN